MSKWECDWCGKLFKRRPRTHCGECMKEFGVKNTKFWFYGGVRFELKKGKMVVDIIEDKE